MTKLSWNNTDKIIQILQKEAVGICTTDTVPGFIGILSDSVFHKINIIKSREDKPYIVLINPQNLGLFVDTEKLSTKIISLLSKCWPGPLTIIFNAKENLPSILQSDKKIALRAPNHTGLQKILKHFDGLFSTSANKSGRPTPKTINDIDPDLLKNVDFLIESLETVCLSSTIVDLSGDKPRVVREGAFKIEELERYYGEKFCK